MTQTNKEKIMTNRVTVAEMMRQMAQMPQDAFVSVQGSYETYDGFSHPEVVMGADGEVVVREAAEPEDYEDSDEDLGALLQAKLFA
jgi:hypothetical protein